MVSVLPGVTPTFVGVLVDVRTPTEPSAPSYVAHAIVEALVESSWL